MGRAPCCEKMGLKKGPWTPEEDKILVAHIQRFGHGNWRALPKQAGLLRCGKSCRLRWINYLRPDIKRGNFSKEEEDTIIHLHQMLGNRWSAIAARLPGRTDNEIKNVWHTHLKKRLDPTTNDKHNKKQQDHAPAANKRKKKHKSVRAKQAAAPEAVVVPATTAAPVSSPERSVSSSVTELSSSVTTTEHEQGVSNAGSSGSASASASAKEESFTSSAEEFQIDESFWSEALSVPPLEGLDDVPMDPPADAFAGAEDMDFWLRVFMETDHVDQELPQI